MGKGIKVYITGLVSWSRCWMKSGIQAVYWESTPGKEWRRKQDQRQTQVHQPCRPRPALAMLVGTRKWSAPSPSSHHVPQWPEVYNLTWLGHWVWAAQEREAWSHKGSFQCSWEEPDGGDNSRLPDGPRACGWAGIWARAHLHANPSQVEGIPNTLQLCSFS